jgi:hypothetical protein
MKDFRASVHLGVRFFGEFKVCEIGQLSFHAEVLKLISAM